MAIFHKLSLVQKIILSIILTVALSVITFSVYAIIHFRPTDTITLVKSYISSMSTDYYENYYFPSLESSIHDHGNSDISEVLSRYTDTGFSRVPLRQIISHVDYDEAALSQITERCDTKSTFVHFFPDPPFTSTSYHVDYEYSCNF